MFAGGGVTDIICFTVAVKIALQVNRGTGAVNWVFCSDIGCVHAL